MKLIDRNLFIYISISFSFNSLALIPLLANSPNTFVMFLIKVSNLRGSKEKNLDLSTSPVEGGNLAASKIRNLECPSYEICLIDYGCGKFNRKIHIMEQYP